MKSYSRKKEVIKSSICLVVCLLGLLLVTIQAEALNVEKESVPPNIESEIVNTVTGESNLSLDLDKIYSYRKAPINEENVEMLLKCYLPAGEYLNRVSVQKDIEPYNVIITYIFEEYLPMISKAHKEQIVLLDSSILLSLFTEIDTIKVNIIVESELYSKVVYRPDLEAHFGIALDAMAGERVFERLANEFTDVDKVSDYWGEQHLYDTNMGEEVEGFFKLNFPVYHEEKSVFPYIDEELENALVEQYGYKLFLQGLSYPNPIMNYYCAYRLVEYYGTEDAEEIMLELAACLTRTEDKNVRKVCDKVMDWLSPLKEEEIRVIGRFKESTLGGGKKLFTISDQGLRVLATWQGDSVAGLKVLTCSPNNRYVICEINTLEKVYQYVLVSSEEGYVIDERGAFKEDLQQKELLSRIQEILVQQDMDIEITNQLEYNWYTESILGIYAKENIIGFYDIQTDTLLTKESFAEQYGTEYLEQYLQMAFEVVEKQVEENKESVAKVIKYKVDDEYILVYEYDSAVQKNSKFLNREEKNTGSMKWSQGKLMIFYNGENEYLIEVLNHMVP